MAACKKCDPRAALQALADPVKAQFSARYFKTGKGQYGQGDRFLGITVPAVRLLAKQFATLPLGDCTKLLAEPYNETRLLALLILVHQYQKAAGQGDFAAQEKIYQLYLAQRHRVNNWNLVDSSAPLIVGAHLLHQDRSVLQELAHSPQLWERRIAVLSTLAFIRANDFSDTLALTKQLLNDPHDLMHKACGWMLREVGKRDPATLHHFLQQHCRHMPRTMLRYAIERFTPTQRSVYLAGVGFIDQAGKNPSIDKYRSPVS